MGGVWGVEPHTPPFCPEVRSLSGPWPGGIVGMVFRELLALLVLVGPLTGPGDAAEYRLRVANLDDKPFEAFIDGAVGLDDGEFAMPRLEVSLDESAGRA
jgi:hypothetical protein